MKSFTFVLFAIAVSSTALAEVEIRFTNQELDSASILLKTNLNRAELNGSQLVFDPAPSLQYLGVQREQVHVDLGFIANIGDLRFNHVRASSPKVAITIAGLQITVPIEDQNQAVRCAVGSISLRGVSIVANIVPHTRTNGNQEWVIQSTRLLGTVTGSGLLRANFILNKAKELMTRELSNQVQRVLNKSQVQEGMRQGLETWAKFSIGRETRGIIPGSIEISRDSSSPAITYRVE